MTPETAYQYLLALPRFEKTTEAYKPGLEKIRRILHAMGNPHLRYPTAHIAGTNGKGSVSSMIAAIGTASGKRVGLYTSPHLFHFTERFRIDGQPAPSDWMARAVTHWKPLFEEEKPSFFEATTALAFVFFAEMDVEAAVIETGLGGRLDATNVIQPLVTAITQIGWDHTEQLGKTLPKIAAEKAGIIKPGIPLFTMASQPEVLEVIRQKAKHKNARFHELFLNGAIQNFRLLPDGFIADIQTPNHAYKRLMVSLNGVHQRENAHLALCCAEILFPEAPEVAVRTGLANVSSLSGLRGRCEVRSQQPLVVADVAHNAEGLEVALRFIRFLGPAKALYVVFGCMKDKSLTNMARMFVREKAHVYIVGLPPPRGYEAQELAAILIDEGLAVTICDSVAEAIHLLKELPAKNKSVLVTGSHQVVAELGTNDDFFSI
ncbi:MAG: bifunctional folylpolyglutamate synthase/dihydrofolate synthase [Bacteroidetes Order II. Incertae sedis bacterium]|nr:bifunctional folylpolyglutamate synthase/dihydrofolate synthase [Bacteroidetes Order II. bacterium]